MSKDREYLLYNKIIHYNDYIRKYVVNNIPNIHRDIRIHLLDESYNLLRNMYEAGYNKGNIRAKYINEMIIIVSMLDYLSGCLLKLCPDMKKLIITSIDELVHIKNMTYAWKANHEKEF